MANRTTSCIDSVSTDYIRDWLTKHYSITFSLTVTSKYASYYGVKYSGFTGLSFGESLTRGGIDRFLEWLGLTFSAHTARNLLHDLIDDLPEYAEIIRAAP